MTSLETTEQSESDSVVTNNKISLNVEMGVSRNNSIPASKTSSVALKFETMDSDKTSIPDTPKSKLKPVVSKKSIRGPKVALKYETKGSKKNSVTNLSRPRSATDTEVDSDVSKQHSIPDLPNQKEALNSETEVSNKDFMHTLPTVKSRAALLKIPTSPKPNAAEMGVSSNELEPTSPCLEIRTPPAHLNQPRVKSFHMGWAQVVEELSWKLTSVSVCTM